MSMKKKFVLFTIILSTIFSLQYASGPASLVGQAYTGAPGESGTLCGSCHSAGAFGTPSTALSITDAMGMPVTSYTPGTTYQIALTAIAGTGSPAGYGFQLTVLDGANNDVANFSNPSSNAKISTAAAIAGGRTYAEHNGVSPTSTFTFDWVAPAATTGDLTFYYNVNLVNGNGGTSGDSGGNGYTSSMNELTPTVKVIGALEVNNAFTFPMVDGTANQVLTTDGMGNVSWMDNAAFKGGTTTSESFKTSPNTNQEILKSEIEAVKKLINKLTKE